MSNIKQNLGGAVKLKKPAKIVVVVSRYNREITDVLEKNCLAELKKAGARHIEIIHVPGAFELPYACQKAIKIHKPAAVIALGCIIKGETPHFDFIASACADGIMQVALKHGVPVVFGVLTVATAAQAKARVLKGTEAARTAIDLLNQK